MQKGRYKLNVWLIRLKKQWTNYSINTKKELYSFADKNTDLEELKIDLQKWLSDMTVKDFKVLRNAREYIGGLTETVKTSQTSVKMAVKAKYASHTSKTYTSWLSKTSS